MIRFTHSGFECMTKVSPMGIPCGYVGLPQSHPYHGKHYNDIDDIEVHGGLTFSAYWEDLGDGLWYLGFDCGHAFDIDDLPTTLPKHPWAFRSNKSDNFVEEQTKRLAEQLEKIRPMAKKTRRKTRRW
jgi:hypothetical protein